MTLRGEPFDKIIETLAKRRCGPWSTIQRGRHGGRGRTKKKEGCWSKRIKYHGMLIQSKVHPKTMFAENIYGCHFIIANWIIALLPISLWPPGHQRQMNVVFKDLCVNGPLKGGTPHNHKTMYSSRTGVSTEILQFWYNQHGLQIIKIGLRLDCKIWKHLFFASLKNSLEQPRILLP